MAIIREYRPQLEENGLILMNESGCFHPNAVKINSTLDAVKVLEAIGLRTEAEENFVVICMNARGKVVGFFRNSCGNASMCSASPRETLKKALLLNAVSVIIAHNHPGGSANPSREDIELTQVFKTAFGAVGIKMLDHVIIPAYSYDYYSFAENGEI